ncbi:cupredoxin domain-containing protein [Blastococcus sp. CT_GayMR16]|uniref:cupredoxin domain-containing protein n=1 Tax=Blastococcus sp. CT_GayMR16 TaxID=2559607 RepID=UPI0014320A33|nr:cupredoxin domain-containing protein [Blastococcus sp. CT_GayMR16]
MPARNRILPHLARGIAVLALGLGALTACGGDDDSGSSATSSSEAPATSAATTSASAPASPSAPGPAAPQTVTATEADFSISLDQDALTAGDYEITVVNNGRASHDLVVEQDGSDIAGTEMIAPGASATLTVDLAAGEYVFYCSVGNHRAMGMELTVQVT